MNSAMSHWVFLPDRIALLKALLISIKVTAMFLRFLLLSGGSRNRTCDLFVMSEASYQLLNPAMCVLLSVSASQHLRC